MIYADNTVMWELNENTLEKKFQRAVMVCTDLGLNVSSNKCVMRISQKEREYGKDYILILVK